MKKTPAQIILVIVALMLIIEPLADGWLGLGMLVDLHIGSSSLWPDHAKFHVIRQAIATILTGLLCAWGLLKYWDYGKGVRWTFALIPFLVNASAVIAINLSPVLGVSNPVSQRGLGAPVIMLSLLLSIVGLFLEKRERKKDL